MLAGSLSQGLHAREERASPGLSAENAIMLLEAFRHVEDSVRSPFLGLEGLEEESTRFWRESWKKRFVKEETTQT